MLEENKIDVIFEKNEPIYVYADDFYIEQVVTNYFTNAMKHAEIVDRKKQIQIRLEQKKSKNESLCI